MATTKIWKIKSRFDNVIDYAINEEKTSKQEDLSYTIRYATNSKKTENKKYVTGINCLPETAYKEMSIVKKQFNKTTGILGFHAYQSFKGYEISSNEAHEIGIQLAEELWGDRFQVIITTHLNTKNVHNHFVINSVSFVDGKKYYDSKKTYALMRKVSDEICQDYCLKTIEENSFYKQSSNRYVRNSNYLNSVREDIDYAIAQAKTYNEFTAILTNMKYELIYRNNVLSIRKEPYKRNIRIVRTFGEEYTKENILFRIKNTFSFKVPFPETHTLTGKYKSKFSVKHKPKTKGLRALYLYYCYLLKVFPKQSYPSKLSKTLKESIRKMDEFSDSVRFLGKHNISTLTELKKFKNISVEKANQLMGVRENLWRKHNRVETNKEKQFICSEIEKLAKQINKLKRDIIICKNIENRVFKMRDVIREMNDNNESNVKYKDKNLAF